MTIDLHSARELFDASTDFTVGIEEEFAILDPTTLDARAALRGAARRGRGGPGARRRHRRRADLLGDRDPLGPRRGRRRRASPRSATPPAAVRARRARTASRSARPAPTPGPTTASSTSSTPSTTAASPGRAAVRRLAQQHVRRCTSTSASAAPTAPSRVCDRLRPVLPLLLAISRELAVPRRPRLRPALGPHPDLHQVVPALRRPRRRSATGRPSPTTSTCSSRTNSIVEYTQLWWSVRPHHDLRHRRGAHLRRADHRRPRPTALAALIVACVAQARARRSTRARPSERPARRLIEENMWRAIRYGLDGRLLDLERAEEYPAPRRSTPAAGRGRAGARRARARTSRCPSSTAPSASGGMIDAGAAPGRGVRRRVRETRETYAQEVAA